MPLPQRQPAFAAATAPVPWAVPRSARSALAWRVVAVLAVLAAAVAHVVVSLSASAPAFPYDEIAILDMSRFIAGDDGVTPLRGAGYYPGWSVLLAPVWWLTSDPSTGYVAAIVIGGVVALATIWPVALVVRRFGTTMAQGVAVGGIVLAMPSRALQADYVMSEKLLFFLVAWVVVAAFAVWERPSLWRMLGFIALVGAMLLSHARVLPVVLAAAVWLLCYLRRNWRIALVGLVALGATYVLVTWVATAVNEAVLESGAFNQSDGFMRNLETTRPSLIARAALGQVWYQLVASFGLVAIGAVGVVAATWRELRAGVVGRAGWVLGATLATMIVSVLAWSGDHNLYFADWRRLDAWLYGRYADPLTAIVVAIGLALVLTRVRWRVLLPAAAASAAILGAVVLWVAPTAPTWAFVTPAHLPGVMPWWSLLPTSEYDESVGIVPAFGNENAFWLVASLAVVAGLAVVAALRRAPVALAVVLIGAFLAATLVADGRSNRFQEVEGGVPPALAGVERAEALAGRQLPVDFDRECSTGDGGPAATQNVTLYWLMPRDIDLVLPSEGAFDADLVISCTDWPLAGELGAERVAGTAKRGMSLWVLPGELQDELARDGALAG